MSQKKVGEVHPVISLKHVIFHYRVILRYLFMHLWLYDCLGAGIGIDDGLAAFCKGERIFSVYVASLFHS